MGSGELAPTMVKVHREILEQLGPPPVPTVLLDTPFGFQENARELAGKAVTYFRESLRTELTVASPGGDVGFADEEATALLRDARYIFAGPGSPTYALREWRDGIVPGLLTEKLTTGGAVTFASAAALTLGAFTVPVYEIYKVGEDPYWLEGLDVLGKLGIHCAVIPHYNNAEGGTHDTHYCYLGERRLRMMEEQLPEDHFVLGVDEHTACIIDLERKTLTVGGIGTVTVRRYGRSTIYPNGAQRVLDEMFADAFADDAPSPAPMIAEALDEADEEVAPSTSPLLDLVREQERAFATAITARDVTSAVAAVLVLERQIVEWSTDVPQQDELDRAHASLRAMIVELGQVAVQGARDPRDVVGPFVESMLELRALARAEQRFADADRVRDRLIALDVELRDSPDGTTWLLNGPSLH
jgi:hypothetical protein